MKHIIYIFLFSFCFSVGAQDLVTKNFRTFQETANLSKASKKNILMVFVNSKESSQSFSSFVSNPEYGATLSKYVFHVVDMSKNNGLSNEEKMLNERLVIHHNKNKRYPSLFVLDSSGNTIADPLLDFSIKENLKFISKLKEL